MMVSGTYCPPYGPKRPRTAGGVSAISVVMCAHSLQKGPNEGRVFATLGILHAAADIDAEWLERGQRGGDVVGTQAAGDHTAWADALQRLPVERDAGAAGESVGVGIEQVPMGSIDVVVDQRRDLRLGADADVQRLEGRQGHGGDDCRRFVAGELHVV